MNALLHTDAPLYAAAALCIGGILLGYWVIRPAWQFARKRRRS